MADLESDAVRENVRGNVRRLLERSPALAERVDAGALYVAGGVYDLETGRVELLDAGSA